MRNKEIHHTSLNSFTRPSSQGTDQSLQKSLHLSSPDTIELKKISSPFENKKHATPQINATQTMAPKLNRVNCLQGRTKEHQLPTFRQKAKDPAKEPLNIIIAILQSID